MIVKCPALRGYPRERIGFAIPMMICPPIFDVQRTTYYTALQQPESADDFIAGVCKAMEDALSRFQ